MNKRLSYVQVEAVANTAESLGYSKGEHVFNVFFLSSTLKGDPEWKLFYCSNSEFWKVLKEFAVII